MRQYEIWWADLDRPVGRRPVLLLSRTPAYRYLAKVIVAEVIGTIREIPQEVGMGPREGLPHTCVANLDNLHVVPKARLGDRIGFLSTARHLEVKRALGYALGWPELKALG